jgi:hypothetical protein
MTKSAAILFQRQPHRDKNLRDYEGCVKVCVAPRTGAFIWRMTWLSARHRFCPALKAINCYILENESWQNVKFADEVLSLATMLASRNAMSSVASMLTSKNVKCKSTARYAAFIFAPVV